MSAREMQLTILRLALRAAERGDAGAAAEALRGVLASASEDDDPPEPVAPELRAVRQTTLARMLDCTPRHVANLVRRGTIPREAIIGEGSGRRYVVAAVLAALGRVPEPSAETAETTTSDRLGARAHVRRRARLRVVGGSQ